MEKSRKNYNRKIVKLKNHENKRRIITRNKIKCKPNNIDNYGKNYHIPLAAGVLYSARFVLDPAVGAVLMSLSTIIVAINAQFLKRKMNK